VDDIDEVRQQYVASLQASLRSGSLSLEDYEAKLDSVYAATTLAELEIVAPLASPTPHLPARQARTARLTLPIAAAIVGAVCLAVALTLAFRSHGAALATTSLPASPVAPAEPPPSPYPGNGYVAVVATSASGHTITIDPNSYADPVDVRYTTCPGFAASSPDGRTTNLATLVGDYATMLVNSSKACAISLAVVTPPSPPACFPGNYGGEITVTYAGSSSLAHSILYERNNSGVVEAIRWCTPPTVAGANQAAETLSAIPPGTTVTLGMFGSGWVSSVTVGQAQ